MDPASTTGESFSRQRETESFFPSEFADGACTDYFAVQSCFEADGPWSQE
jgi:hypothetical protein